MHTRTLMLGALLITALCAAVSCNKSDSSPSSADKLIGTWKALDQVPSQVDIYRFNAGGTGTDTRTLGPNNPFVVNFTWTVNASEVLDIKTIDWTPGNHSATIEGPQHIDTLTDRVLVVKSINDPNYPTREFEKQ